LTLVGLLLLARKHRIDLTAAIKSRFVRVAVMLVSAPLLRALGVLIHEDFSDSMFDDGEEGISI
ncbi:MAG: hypothetical protein IH991_09830, partial [Planctomycetes bacterium]|nr:hypothetical protein [Planctomycetota bacterium]